VNSATPSEAGERKSLCLSQSPQGSQRRKKEYRIQASGCRFLTPDSRLLTPDSLNLVPAFPCEPCGPERSWREKKQFRVFKVSALKQEFVFLSFFLDPRTSRLDPVFYRQLFANGKKPILIYLCLTPFLISLKVSGTSGPRGKSREPFFCQMSRADPSAL